MTPRGPSLQAPAPFVGRDADLAALLRLVGLDDGRAGGVVLVAGDAGVGKTRLLAALCERAGAAGWRTLTGHCLDFGDSALPYLPFTEVMGRLAQDDPAAAHRTAQQHPALGQLLPGRRVLPGRATPAAPGPADPSLLPVPIPRQEPIERSDLFEAVHLGLDAVAESGPLLLVLEDLHWADRSTRDLLSYLFLRRFAGPVALVASYRSDDLHRRHPLRASLAEWGRMPGVERLTLDPLPEPAVRHLVSALGTASGTSDLQERDVHAIVARAEGNPFFVEELVGATGDGGRRLPQDLAGLLLLRLDHLDDDARLVARVAACAGRQVSHELLAAVAGLPEDRLDRAVRQAVEHNVLAPSETRYVFRHALLAEAVYDDLLPGERVGLHAAYADALVAGDVEGTAAELARHARLAHDVVTALSASIRAGDEAMAVGGPQDAAGHYQLALELLDSPAAEGVEVDRVLLAARTVNAVLSAGDAHRALGLAQEQLARLPQDTEPGDRARLHLSAAAAALNTDTDVDPLAHTGAALDLLGPEPTVLRAKVLSTHALAHSQRRETEDAARWAQEALVLGERLGIARVVTDASTTLARLREHSGDLAESRQTFERIVARAHEDGDVAAELRGLHHLGAQLAEAGELAQAAAVYRRATHRAKETGMRWAPYGFDARLMGAINAYVSGDWDKALLIADPAGDSPPELAAGLLEGVRLAVAAGRGEHAALERLPLNRRVWDREGFAAILGGAAAIDLHGDAGELDAATRIHDEVVQHVSALWRMGGWMAQVRLAGLLLGQLSRRVGDATGEERRGRVSRGADLVASAERVMRASRDRGLRIGPEGLAWEARVYAEQARLCWLADVDPPGPADLVAAWEQAVDAFATYGHVFEEARSRARLAAVLRALGETERARTEATAAQEAATRLGADPLLTELRAAGAPRVRAAGPGSTALTAREHEILTLVAQGRSNGEIGRQLFISTKTVSVHVSRVLAKLGVASRTEAAAVARRRGLFDD